MILHLFSIENNSFVNTVEYPEGRTPNGYLVFEGNLPDWKEPERLVLLAGIPKVLNEYEWTLHRIAIGDLEISDSQKVNADGSIVSKSELELQESLSPKEAHKQVYQKISSFAANQIVSGFVSSALGSEHKYDTSLEDQFNIKAVKDMNVDAPIRCLNVQSKVKTFIPHSKEQIKKVHDDFVVFKQSILMRADEEKKVANSLLASGKSSKEIFDWWSLNNG